jgi:hypothetical protein
MERKVLNELTLPSGKKAVIYDGIGEDFLTAIENAEKVSGGRPGFKDVVISLMELLVKVDGKPLTEPELRAMPIKDFLILYRHFLEVLG